MHLLNRQRVLLETCCAQPKPPATRCLVASADCGAPSGATP
jgi:hypothetical protein